LYEPVQCPNAAAGCTASILCKDAARHASEACGYRKIPCAFCHKTFEARAGHEGSCPEAQIECPNAGCVVTVARKEIGEHRGVCGREEVGCPCPGCEERVLRAEVEEHVAASGAVHVRRAWEKVTGLEEKVAGLEDKVADQGSVIMKQKEEIAGMQRRADALTHVFTWSTDSIMKQKEEIAGMQRRADALTHVFTWSTDSEWSAVQSDAHAFTGGVVGKCSNGEFEVVIPDDEDLPYYDDAPYFIIFKLEEGPACTMHYKCSILDKNDKVLRVVSDPADVDFRQPSLETVTAGREMAAAFLTLTDADKARAVRADGSIKLCMVVHLYLPWV
jgi:hypothetical protein